MYKKILVPLDGSPVAEKVLPYARALAKALDFPVELLHAIDPDVIALYSDPKHGRYANSVTADLQRKNLDYLKNLQGSFPKPSMVSCSAEVGRPADVIVVKGAAQPGTLIAMATHGRSGVQRWLLGSVAEKVLQTASNHVLLVRAGVETQAAVAPLKTVLVPLDGSALAEKVLPYVAEMATKMDLEVVLVRVYAIPITYFSGEDFYTPALDRILEEAKQEAKQYLERKVGDLQRQGLKRVSSVFLEGDGAGQIIDLARKTPGNLVAMCTHGRSGVGRLVLGSVTNRVVRHSGDPVLIIRATAGA